MLANEDYKNEVHQKLLYSGSEARLDAIDYVV